MESLMTATLKDSSSERAQQQLDALRTAVETRLTALEAVLADPNRGESLEGLILDLARVATEEARAAALKTALDAKLDADARVAHAQMVAQEAIDEERVVSGELRRTIEQAKQRIASLEHGQLTQLRSLREDLESEIARERATAASFERTAAEMQRQLEAERGSVGDVQEAVEKERRFSAELRAAAEADRTVTAELRLALDAERAVVADLRLAVDAERAAADELRRAAEQARTESATLAREKSEAWAAQDALTVALARDRDGTMRLQRQNEELERELVAARTEADTIRAEADTIRNEADIIRVDLEAAGARLEMLDAERLRADGARKELEAQLDALIRERDTLTTELQAARQLPSHVALGAPIVPVIGLEPTPVVNVAPQAAQAAQPAQASPGAPGAPPTRPTVEEEWGPVRLAVRHAFRQPIPVQINGDSGLLVDLSVAGCQLVSSSSVRPNQVVKVLLPTEETTIACTGKVMWARFEPRAAGGSIGYRAGVLFTKPDQSALEAFLSASRLPPPQ